MKPMNERSKAIINFINNFGAADSWQTQRVFFQKDLTGEFELNHADQAAQRVLKGLYEKKLINRTEKLDPFTGRYVYYSGSKAQLTHKLLITEFYVRLSCGPGEIREWDNHVTIDGVHPDFYCAYQVDSSVFTFFGEIQISANPLNLQKYIKLKDEWDSELPFPDLIVVSNRNYKPDPRLRMYLLGTDYEGWEKILKI